MPEPAYSYKIKKANRTNSPSNYELSGLKASSLFETEEGDLVVSAEGDILIATPNETVVQFVTFVIKTLLNEAKLYPKRGTNLRSFIGGQMRPHVFDKIRDSLIFSLYENNVGFSEESLEVLPLGDSIILISFKIIVPTGDIVQLGYKFDVMSGLIEDVGGVQV
jgi:hypothetical protein